MNKKSFIVLVCLFISFSIFPLFVSGFRICPLDPYTDILNVQTGHTYRFYYTNTNPEEKVIFTLSESGNGSYLLIEYLTEPSGSFDFTADNTESLYVNIFVDLFRGKCVFIDWDYEDLTISITNIVISIVIISFLVFMMITFLVIYKNIIQKQRKDIDKKLI